MTSQKGAALPTLLEVVRSRWYPDGPPGYDALDGMAVDEDPRRAPAVFAHPGEKARLHGGQVVVVVHLGRGTDEDDLPHEGAFVAHPLAPKISLGGADEEAVPPRAVAHRQGTEVPPRRGQGKGAGVLAQVGRPELVRLVGEEHPDLGPRGFRVGDAAQEKLGLELVRRRIEDGEGLGAQLPLVHGLARSRPCPRGGASFRRRPRGRQATAVPANSRSGFSRGRLVTRLHRPSPPQRVTICSWKSSPSDQARFRPRRQKATPSPPRPFSRATRPSRACFASGNRTVTRRHRPPRRARKRRRVSPSVKRREAIWVI